MADLYSLNGMVTLDIQDHLILISSFHSINNLSIQVWLKSTHWFRRKYTKKADFYILYWIVAFKSRSRSPKPDQPFIVPQENNIQRLDLSFDSRDSMEKPYFGRILTFQSTGVTLKIRSRSPNLINPTPF